jgi:hypothetical protein
MWWLILRETRVEDVEVSAAADDFQMITSAFLLGVLILLHSAQAQMLYTQRVGDHRSGTDGLGS